MLIKKKKSNALNKNVYDSPFEIHPRNRPKPAYIPPRSQLISINATMPKLILKKTAPLELQFYSVSTNIYPQFINAKIPKKLIEENAAPLEHQSHFISTDINPHNFSATIIKKLTVKKTTALKHQPDVMSINTNSQNVNPTIAASKLRRGMFSAPSNYTNNYKQKFNVPGSFNENHPCTNPKPCLLACQAHYMPIDSSSMLLVPSVNIICNCYEAKLFNANMWHKQNDPAENNHRSPMPPLNTSFFHASHNTLYEYLTECTDLLNTELPQNNFRYLVHPRNCCTTLTLTPHPP